MSFGQTIRKNDDGFRREDHQWIIDRLVKLHRVAAATGTNQVEVVKTEIGSE